MRRPGSRSKSADQVSRVIIGELQRDRPAPYAEVTQMAALSETTPNATVSSSVAASTAHDLQAKLRELGQIAPKLPAG
jgi:hypothetical protein